MRLADLVRTLVTNLFTLFLSFLLFTQLRKADEKESHTHLSFQDSFNQPISALPQHTQGIKTPRYDTSLQSTPPPLASRPFHVVDPGPTTNKPHQITTIPEVMVFILSRRDSVRSRGIFRDIFVGSGVHFIFVVGSCCLIPETLREIYTCEQGADKTKVTSADTHSRSLQCNSKCFKIQDEITLYCDIIITNTTDVYRHLPTKVRFLLYWGVHNRNFSFFVKVDEDQFINPAALSKFISRRSPDEYSITGHIVKGYVIHRVGKWKELVYKRGVLNAKYPQFPLGSREWIMSRNVATYISQHTLQLFDYPGEDVSIGILLNVSSIVHDIQWISSHDMRADGNCLNHQDIIVGHNLTPNQIWLCWEAQAHLRT